MIVVALLKSRQCIGDKEISKKHCNNNDDCPTWTICNHENKCQCGDGHDDAVVCDDNLNSAVLNCHCVTYDRGTGKTHLGACFFNCDNHNKKDKVLIRETLPHSPEKLNNQSVCTPFHRTGLLCGDCEDGHSPLVFSYDLTCVKCPDGHKNWWRFILVALVPLTFFYFFIVLFNINVTSSRLHGVVWFSQALSMPAFARLIFSAVRYHGNLQSAVKVFLVFYSFWNLDILRSVLPGICLQVTTLQVLALDYILALYPYILILLSYFFIELYDRKYFIIIVVWKPFHKLLTLFRKSWDIRTSVIDSFSTFFLLSYVKILSVSTDLLVPTQIYQLGSNKTSFGLYYSPSVVYFGKEHLPYAILAIAILSLCIFIPTIVLLLYPLKLFQKSLSIFPFNWHFLHAFVDPFQGCYKDGTEPGTFDCRWFASMVLLVRLIFFFTFGLTLSAMFFIYTTIILGLFLILLINIQPFKKIAAHYPSTDVVFFVLLSLGYVTVIERNVANTENNHVYTTVILCVAVLAVFAPIIYITALILFWIISQLKWIKSLLLRIDQNHKPNYLVV